MGVGHLEVFLFKFSIHVGVVTICSVGIVLMSTSLWVNFMTQDPEIKTWASGGKTNMAPVKALMHYVQPCHAVLNVHITSVSMNWDAIFLWVHWTVVSVFDFSGLGIYTLGMIAAYAESSRLANLLFIFLVLHCILWLALTIISFGNWATMNRAVCIDNRCADRLFIKNGNWRITFDGDCENPSIERWLESAGPNRPMTEVEKMQEDDGKAEMKRSLNPSRVEENNQEHEEIIKLLETLTRNVSLLEEQLGALLNNRSAIDYKLQDVLWKSSSGYNKTLIHTPIGYVGCNSPAHIAYSAICALLIFAFWYIYPIFVVKSYADILKHKRLSTL